MRQQINLYQAAFHERSTPLAARTALAALGIVCVALLLWQIYDGREVAQLVTEVQAAQAQTQRQSELAAAVAAALATRGSPASLQARAKHLAALLGERRRVLELLQNGVAGSAGGFADRLEALARRRVDGIWLDHIVLGDAVGVSSLAGHTLDPDLVPQYFHALAAEQALRGTRFDDFRIGASPNHDAASGDAPNGPGAGDAASVIGSKAPQPTSGATRFRASGASPLTTQPKGNS
jgi:hypothetical protein